MKKADKRKLLKSSGKQFLSVADMVEDLSGTLARIEFEALIARSNLSSEMSILRVKKSLLAGEVAETMNVSSSVVDRIEASDDDNLKLSDIRRYLEVLGFTNFTIQYTNGKFGLLIESTKWGVL